MKTPAERVKASRIRKAIRLGQSVSDKDREWLSAYGPDSAPLTIDATPLAVTDAVVASAPRLPSVSHATPDVTPSQAPPVASSGNVAPGNASGFPVLDFGLAPNVTQTATVAATCPAGPNCPRCAKARNQVVGPTCATANEIVYPRMSDEAAHGTASGLLFCISILVNTFTDKNVTFTQDDGKRLGNVAATFLYKRQIPFANGADDIIALVMVVVSLGVKVANAPTKEKKKELKQ